MLVIKGVHTPRSGIVSRNFHLQTESAYGIKVTQEDIVAYVTFRCSFAERRGEPVGKKKGKEKINTRS